MIYRIMHKSGFPVKTGNTLPFYFALNIRYYPDEKMALKKILSNRKDGGRMYTKKEVAEHLCNVLNSRFIGEFSLEER